MKSQDDANCDRFSRNWRKKKLKDLGISLVVAFVLAMVIRTTIAEDFVAATDAVAPEIRKSNHMLVYKLERKYSAGDIIVYRKPGEKSLVGRVKSSDQQSAKVTVERNNEPTETVPLSQVIGRVILNSRQASQNQRSTARSEIRTQSERSWSVLVFSSDSRIQTVSLPGCR